VTGSWRKVHNEELHNLYASLNILRTMKSRKMRFAGNVARVGAKRNTHESQKERDSWEDLEIGGRVILKMDFRGIRWDDIDWIDVAQDRDQWRAVVNTVMNIPVS
jgi:hypothetical protein